MKVQNLLILVDYTMIQFFNSILKKNYIKNIMYIALR